MAEKRDEKKIEVKNMTEEQAEMKQQNALKKKDHEQLTQIQSIDATKNSYGANYQKHLLEQYKMYVEMMDKVTERRGKANSFYLSLLSGLLALLSLLAEKDLLPEPKDIFLLVLAFLGLLLCCVWYININSYKQLNKLKFRIIYEMEKHLPFPCYKREWEILDPKNGHRQHKQYRRLTKVEKYVPFILAIPYLGLLIYVLKNLINKIN